MLPWALELRVMSRNSKVTNKLTRSYQTNTRDNIRVPTFCILNYQYMLHVNDPDHTNPSTLQVGSTQVPSLRAHIYSMPSKGKVHTPERYSLRGVVTLMKIIEMACSTSTLERKDHLKKKKNPNRRDCKLVSPFISSVFLSSLECVLPNKRSFQELLFL